MPLDSINRKTYEKKVTTQAYAYYRLQNPEAIILVKYKDTIWGKHILDIGCGAGRTTFFLRNFSKHYTGIDYSSEMINFCRRKFQDVRLIQCDVRDMTTFEDSLFAFALFSFNGLDYMAHDDRLSALREIHRVLNPDGVFAFSSHNKRFLESVWGGRTPYPNIKFALNPVKQIKSIINFLISTYNYANNKKHQQFEKDYSIVIGMIHNYSVLTYYIDKKAQVSQLRALGFQVIEMYDQHGNLLTFDGNDTASRWIYYVARKIS